MVSRVGKCKVMGVLDRAAHEKRTSAGVMNKAAFMLRPIANSRAVVMLFRYAATMASTRAGPSVASGKRTKLTVLPLMKSESVTELSVRKRK